MSQAFVQAKPSVGGVSQGHGPFQRAIAERRTWADEGSGAPDQRLGPRADEATGGDGDGDTEDASGFGHMGEPVDEGPEQTRPTREPSRPRQARAEEERGEPGQLAVMRPQGVGTQTHQRAPMAPRMSVATADRAGLSS